MAALNDRLDLEHLVKPAALRVCSRDLTLSFLQLRVQARHPIYSFEAGRRRFLLQKCPSLRPQHPPCSCDCYCTGRIVCPKQADRAYPRHEKP
jgi:hypothetical protein